MRAATIVWWTYIHLHGGELFTNKPTQITVSNIPDEGPGLDTLGLPLADFCVWEMAQLYH